VAELVAVDPGEGVVQPVSGYVTQNQLVLIFTKNAVATLNPL